MGEPTTSIRIDERPGVSLSELRPADALALVKHLNDRDIYENTLRIPFPYSDDDANWFIEHAGETAAQHGHPLHFAIRQQQGELIGGCGFNSVAYEHRAEIGYWLAKPFWGRGIMTDVVRTLCEHAISQWKLIRITAHVFEFNVASARVLQKCGFQLEGRLRKHHVKDGRPIDSQLYALVR